MLTREDDVDAHALYRQGWKISAIAEHLGHDRKTIRGYLSGDRVAGQRAASTPDPLGPFLGYVTQRLVDDPHLWATTLFDEVVALGFGLSYPSFTRGLRAHRLRPHCEPCSASTGRDRAIIDHPPGGETQWDWLELPDPPAQWGLPGGAHLLVGAMPHSGQWRGLLAEDETLPQLVAGLHEVSHRLGGLARTWRFDRMATVANPATGRVNATFAAVAKHYGVQVALCPPRHGNRKGTVEKANDTAAQRWWRTVPDEFTLTAAQQSLDAHCVAVGDTRVRRRDGQAVTVAELAAAERAWLAPLPVVFPAVLTVTPTVTPQALVPFDGNFYSVPPGLSGTVVTLTHRLGSPTVDIATAAGVVLARHHRAPRGAGAVIRADGHVQALTTAVLAAFTTGKPCQRKTRRPPSAAALAHARTLSGAGGGTSPLGRAVVVDLAVWAQAARTRQVAP
jgi:transposase